MSSGGPNEIGAVFVNVVPSLAGGEDAIRAGAARAADEYAQVFNERLGPAMSRGSQSLGAEVSGNLLKNVAGPFKELLDKVGVDFSHGMKGAGAAGGAALGAGMAAAVVAGAELIRSDVRNVVKLVDGEFRAFGKVGTDAADTLMGGFKSAVSGQMPDAMAAFNVVEEAARTSFELPFNVANTAIDNTIGRVPILGGIVKSEIGAVESAFGGLFSVFDEFKSLGGEYLQTLVDIGDKYTEISRTIAGSTVDTGQIGALTEAVREIAASGAVANVDDVASAIGRLNTNIRGLSGDQLKELTTNFAVAEQLVGHIDPTQIAGIFNAFKVAPGDTAEELTRLVNAARATGIGINSLTQEMTTSGPAMRKLGYNIDQTASFFATMTQQGEKGAALVRSLNTVVAKLADDVTKGQFKSIEDGWQHTIAAVKDYIKAGNEAAAIDMLKNMGAGRNAALIVEDVKNGVLDVASAMKQLPNLDTPLSEAEEKTRTLGEAWKVVGIQISAALAPIGTQLAKSLTEASAHISTWIKDNKAKIVAWGADIAKVVIDGMAFVGTWAVNVLAAFAPILDGFKDMVIVAVKTMMAPLEAVAKALALLPGQAGKPFKDFVGSAENLKKTLNEGMNFSLTGELDKVKHAADDFYNNVIPKINKGLDDVKNHAQGGDDKFSRLRDALEARSRATGGAEAGSDTDTGAGGAGGDTDTGAPPPPLSSFPKPGAARPSAGAYPVPSAPFPVTPPTAAPGVPFPTTGGATSGNARLRAGDYPLGQSVDGIPMPPVPVNGMTLKEYRQWATQTVRFGQEGTDLATEQQQAQAEIGTKGAQYAKDYGEAQRLQAELDAMSPNDPTRADKQKKLDQALEKLTASLKASTDANDRLLKVNERIADRDVQGPPEPPKADKGAGDKDAETLGRGIAKGLAQELGLGDVFKTLTGAAAKPPWQWGGSKILTGFLGALLGPMFAGGESSYSGAGGYGVGSGVPLLRVPGDGNNALLGGSSGWPAGPGNLPGTPPQAGGTKAGVASYIYQAALARGYSPDDATAIVAYAVGESGLDPTSNGGPQGGPGPENTVIGLFQEKPGFAKAGGIDPALRNTIEGNVTAYLNQLQAHRGTGDILDQLLATSQGGPMATGGRAAMQNLIAQARGILGPTPASGAAPSNVAPSGYAGGGLGLNPATMASSLGGAGVTYTPDFLRQHGVAPVFEKASPGSMAGAPPWVSQLAGMFHLSVTDHPDSTLHGGQSGRGNSIDPMGSWAFDFSGAVDDEQRFADYIRQYLAPQTLQAIWQNPQTGQQLGIAGGQILGQGQYYTGSEGYSAHTDHVHWATDVPPILPGMAPLPRALAQLTPAAIPAAMTATTPVHVDGPGNSRGVTPGPTINVDASGLMHPAQVGAAVAPYVTPGATPQSPAPPPAMAGGAGIPV